MNEHATPHFFTNWATEVRGLARRNWHNVVFAISLVIASSMFVDLFASFAELEYGAPPLSVPYVCRLDCGWYSSIVIDGYHQEPVAHPKGDAANWAFFPAFPLVAKLVVLATGASAQLALVLTSKFFLFLSLWTFLALVEEELGSEAKLTAGLLLAFNPYIIYAHAGYTETLYFFLTSLSFLLLHRRRCVLAGIVGGLLSATRLVGIVFVVSYLLNLRKFFRETKLTQLPGYLLGLSTIPLGLGLYMAYLHFHVGDALAFKHVQVAWGRSIGNPLAILETGLLTGGWERFFALVALASLVMSVWLAIQRRFDYAVFLASATLVPLATGLWSMPRYVFWQMPFLFGMLELLSKYKFLSHVYLVLAGGMGAVVIMSWLSGKSFVI